MEEEERDFCVELSVVTWGRRQTDRERDTTYVHVCIMIKWKADAP